MPSLYGEERFIKLEPKGKNRKKRLLILVAAILIVSAATIFVSMKYVDSVGSENIVFYDYAKDIKHHDYAIVPGAAIKDGMPSLQLENRLKAACKLYNEGKVDYIIISDSNDGVLNVMASFLAINNIPSNTIYQDTEGEDTYSTLKRSGEAFTDATFYFLTQEQYSNRAGYIMDSLNVDGQVMVADNIIYQQSTKKILREEFAKIKAILNVNLSFTSSTALIKDIPFVSTVAD